MLLALVCAALSAPLDLDFSAPTVARAPLRVGVISGPTGPDGAVDLTARFKEFGIHLVRNNDYYDDRLDMESILDCGGNSYPSWEGCTAGSENSYHWEAADALMKTFQDGGFEPMLRLGGEWQNAGRHHDFKGPQNAEQEDNWVTAATKVVDRYRYRYAYVDIWTEFPGSKFWDRRSDEFYPFWIKAFRAVKMAVPEARVGGPGFAVLPTKRLIAGDRSVESRQFLEALYAERIRPDWIGWHIFSNEPAEYAQAGLAYRRLLDGVGEFSDVSWARTGFFTGVELVLDAFGTATDKRHPLDAETLEELHNGPRGGALLGAIFIALSQTDTTRAYYYRANDPSAASATAHRPAPATEAPAGGRPAGRARSQSGLPRPPRHPGAGAAASAAGSEGWTGLFGGDAGATPKPTAQAVRLWSRFSEDFPTQVSVAAPVGEGVWALLHTGSSGSALFLANTSSAPITVTLSGATSSGDASATAWVVDKHRDGLAAEPIKHSISLPAWGVALVIRGK